MTLHGDSVGHHQSVRRDVVKFPIDLEVLIPATGIFGYLQDGTV
jgi:hypothetical protein